ncbi:MAG TPA: HU family DNA-binding protein [Roseovarius sp.]
MAGRKTTGSKTETKGAKPARASGAAPQASSAPRPRGIATTLVPKPPLTGGHAPDTGAGIDGPLPLKKQELIAKVVEQSEVPKKHAKPVIEAMLAVLGEALGEGRDLNLQPMGKIKRKRVKDTGTARVIVANIRQPNAPAAGGGAPVRPAATAGSKADKDQAANRGKEAVADNAE